MRQEYTGGSVSYYRVKVTHPTKIARPYEAECNDIIEALGMTYAEGNAFKAIWRKCAARTLGLSKHGYTDGLYDAEKVEFFGSRMVVQEKAAHSALEEPAAQIDDESDRRQAIDQNGNDGAVYDDPWYGAPEWARFKAQDERGEWWWFEDRPTKSARMWVALVEDVPGSAGGAMVAAAGAQNPNWRDTLIERTSGQDPQE